MTNTINACTRCSPGMWSMAPPAATASALVVDTFMKTELVKIAPRGVAIISVYRPKTGLTAASSAVAMAWGTLTTAKVSPATRSAGNPWRVGRYSA
ncbi:MAG: hypothetical protein R2854_18755 [Caldilineaceae bacterium]